MAELFTQDLSSLLVSLQDALMRSMTAKGD